MRNANGILHAEIADVGKCVKNVGQPERPLVVGTVFFPEKLDHYWFEFVDRQSRGMIPMATAPARYFALAD